MKRLENSKSSEDKEDKDKTDPDSPKERADSQFERAESTTINEGGEEE